jgi:hypothetical protein
MKETVKVLNAQMQIQLMAAEVLEHSAPGENLADCYEEWFSFLTNPIQIAFATKYRGAIIFSAIELKD